MWYDELLAPKTWIVAVATAPVTIGIGMLIERFRVRRKYRHLAGLVGAYQLWEPDSQRTTSTGTVHIHRQDNEVLHFTGRSAILIEPQRAFSGALVFTHHGMNSFTGTYNHHEGDMRGSLEGAIVDHWPTPNLLLTHNWEDSTGATRKVKTKWIRLKT